MKVNKLTLSNFRNIEELVFLPCDGVNIINGDNAQGKTNLIEAMWLFTGAKSFRGAKDAEFLTFGGEHTALSLEFTAEGREQTAGIKLAAAGPKKKEVLLNDVPKSSVTSFAGAFCAVVFSPDHLAIVSDGPGERRRFLDTALTQVRPVYDRLISDYQKALAQRNALLRELPRRAQLADTLCVWDERLARTGASIMRLRMKYIRRLGEEASAVYAGIAQEKERLAVGYQPSVPIKDPCCADLHMLYDALLTALTDTQCEDIKAGFTTRGIHRDELELTIDGMPVRLYGSQGQRRSVVLSLKLAEGNLLKEVRGENPVILFDDVMSELDNARQQYILNNVKDRQVFITCCDSVVCDCLARGRTFSIRGGAITGEGRENESMPPQKEGSP